MTKHETIGYVAHVFNGKEEQMANVVTYIKSKGFIPSELVDNEVSWFYNNLGIDDMYFMLEPVPTIANHILALYGSKIFSYTKNDPELDVNLERETDEGAVYIHTSRPGISKTNVVSVEKRIDEKYLNNSSVNGTCYRMETYRSRGTVSSSITTQLRCYFVSKCNFVTAHPTAEEETDIKLISDKHFLESATPNTLELYGRIIRTVVARTGPVIEMFEIPHSREKRLVIAYRQRSTVDYFSALSDLYHYYDLYSTRKYVGTCS
jgi:glutamate dehydrogenase